MQVHQIIYPVLYTPTLFFLMALTAKKYSSTCLMRIALIAQLISKQAKQSRIQQQRTFVAPV